MVDNDNIKAVEPEEIQKAKNGGPYAVKIQLGWTLNGPLGKQDSCTTRSSNFIETETKLTQQFEQFCDWKFNDTCDEWKQEFSKDDHKAYDIMKDSVRLNDGHYEIALPWRTETSLSLHDKSLALHRLNLIKRRLAKDQQFFEDYSKFIEGLLKKTYAERIPEQERYRSDGPVW